MFLKNNYTFRMVGEKMPMKNNYTFRMAGEKMSMGVHRNKRNLR
jgi:hypothetical protein